MSAETLSKKDLRMLIFSSMEEREKSKRLFQTDEELKHFTYFDFSVSPIVSEKAIPLLKKKGMKFEVASHVDEDELTPRQLKLLQQGEAFSVEISRLGLSFLVEQSPPEWPESERWHYEKT